MKKGFTLVELLAVITILLILVMLTIPAVTKIINTSEKTVYDVQIDKILSATYDYSLKNLSVLPERDKKSYITLSELIYAGYIDQLINPKTNEPFPNEYLISIENVGSNYKNTDKYSKKSGDYLYKIEYEEMNNSEYLSNKPTIYLSGLSISSDGYTSILDQGDAFIQPVPIVYDNNNVDITDSVQLVENITFNGNIVTNIDTYKIGIYKINYVAIYFDSNDKPYASSVVWNVVIADNEAPSLSVPPGTTLRQGDTADTFDIMEGVSCTDNSGDCTITYDGKIEFGVPGIYLITYYAKDTSGNQTSAERYISVYRD